MKQRTTIFIILAFTVISALAQSPQAFSYQAAVRDTLGNIVTNQAVAVQISILEDSVGGIPAYIEVHSSTTNQLGLVNLQIGRGTPVSNTFFYDLDWKNHEHFVKVEIDVNGGTSYNLMSTSQLLSVPYALYGEDADADPENENQQLSINGDTIFISNGNFLVIPGLSFVGILLSLPSSVQQRLDGGETPKQIYDSGIPLETLYGRTYQEGLIFYLDSTTGAGLVAAPADQSSGIVWWNGSYTTTGATGAAIGTGQANTNAIIASQGAGTYAATICDGLTIGIYSDWFLPSKDELNQMYVNLKINGLGGFANEYYWSSTEDVTNLLHSAGRQNFTFGNQGTTSKTNTEAVRAIRAF